MEDLQRALGAAKELYRTALANLERISNDIHAQRNADKGLELPPRTPGVGAEADCCQQMDSLSINLGKSRVSQSSHVNLVPVISWSGTHSARSSACCTA